MPRTYGDQALVQPRRPQLGGEPEVEDHDPALPGHQHVRGFQVAVELARLVEGGDPLGQLPQGDPQPGQGLRRQAESADGFEAGSRRGPLRARGSGSPKASWWTIPEPGPSAARRVPGRSVVSGTGAGGSAPDRTKRQEIDPVDELHGEEPVGPSAVSSWSATRLGWDDVGQGPELLLEAEERRGIGRASGS